MGFGREHGMSQPKRRLSVRSSSPVDRHQFGHYPIFEFVPDRRSLARNPEFSSRRWIRASAIYRKARIPLQRRPTIRGASDPGYLF
jgi:hypothetical protein